MSQSSSQPASKPTSSIWKRALTLLAFTMLVAGQAFATYIVVLKDGTQYAAKEKWTVKDGKAIVVLENGQLLQLDPALIDVPKSEQLTKIGMANANVIDLTPKTGQSAPKKEESLGSQIKLRRPKDLQTDDDATGGKKPFSPLPTSQGKVPQEVIEKFERAYDNVGIFEKKVVAAGSHALRAEMTIDTEERVFNAISATSFLMVRNAGVDGVVLEMVELYMKTTNGGSAGRFQMTRADAEAIDKQKITQQEYFVRRVIY